MTEGREFGSPAADGLTDQQRQIVAWEDGPLVVIAGAGTGKTSVIVERVRRLLATKGVPAAKGAPAAIADRDGHDAPDGETPFAGPLVPEQILVLTYNVKAAHELRERLRRALGPAVTARLTVANFHSFCHRIVTDFAPEAGLPASPDALDEIGQLLLLRDIWPTLSLRYHLSNGAPGDWPGRIASFIARAKDELVDPDDFDAYVAREGAAFEKRFGPLRPVLDRLAAQGAFERGPTDVRPEYARFRADERAAERGDPAAAPDFSAVEKIADREARRTAGGTGGALRPGQLTAEHRAQAGALAPGYVRDGAALEVLRLAEIARLYRAYEAERTRRGALDFGEQIAAAIALFRRRPNVLRHWQRRFRYILVDEFQDANIAQIELIELLGRTPDRPDNVMVVGDDDQSIYRFRGASYAAFVEFDRRFAAPPAHDPGGAAPGAPRRMRIDRNFRSLPPILTVANRLIGGNALRYEPDKRLTPARRATDAGTAPPAVELWTCDGPDGEAAAIADRIRALAGWDPAVGGAPRTPWSSFAVLYRKHKHRQAIAARLREEGIPHTVAGGLSLFARPEIRDLEQALRMVADPLDDVAAARVLTAGPWRLDAIELLALTRSAARAERHLLELARDALSGAETALPLGPETLAKLRRLLATVDDLAPDAPREGPFTIVSRWVERTGLLFDLLAADTMESRRSVAGIASLMRFAADWEHEHPRLSLRDFVAYLDAYQDAGGELPTGVELAEDAVGVRLMTLYQAKGLEYDHVFVPFLLEGEWPVGERNDTLFPRELLREVVPAGDVHIEEERRLLYVALTRARETLVLSTQGGPSVAKKDPSRFLDEVRTCAGDELAESDRAAEGGDGAAGLERLVALPSPRERRAALRLRAAELLSLIEGIAVDDPEAVDARAALTAQLAGVGEAAAASADAARAAGLDPLTLRTVVGDPATGAGLLAVAPLPGAFSYSQFDTYDRCPAMYAYRHVYRIPVADTAAALTFGSTAHAAFEAFTRQRRERLAAGEPPPTREDLERHFEAAWKPSGFADRMAEDTYRLRVRSLLDNFWAGELEGIGEALAEELPFELRLEPPDGGPAVLVHGSIDRVDRLPSGGVEVIDYKTGRISSQKGVDENLQLSVYALACRDQLGLGTPERVTLYFTEAATRLSTVRSDEQLDAAREELLARAARIRSGDFAATPSERQCSWCDYRAVCPSRWH